MRRDQGAKIARQPAFISELYVDTSVCVGVEDRVGFVQKLGPCSARNTRPRSPVSSGSGGGNVEDILKRLGNVETGVSELRSDVSAVLAIIPHLATKADVADVRVDLSAQIGQLRADLSAGMGQAQANLAAAETAIIKWIIATVLASAALAFTIAKFVH